MRPSPSLSHPCLSPAPSRSLQGLRAEFLEVNFPLRRAIPGQPATMAKVKVENPIPGLEKELPKGARFERGGPAFAGAGVAGANAAGETPVSVVQLAKRVAADQLGLCVPFLSRSLDRSQQ